MNDIMSAKGRRNYLFAIPIMIGSVLLFLSLVWLAKAQPGGNNPLIVLEATNCVVANVTTNSCNGASLTLIAPIEAPIVCIGSQVTITAGTNITLGDMIVETNYSNSSECPPAYGTNSVSPTSVMITWTARGNAV